MKTAEFKARMSAFASSGIPFFFLIDFEMQKPLIYTLKEAANLGFKFEINGFKNFTESEKHTNLTPFSIAPVPKKVYKKAFNKVKEEITHGNTFLLNLTFPSEIKNELSFEDIFHLAKAQYKLIHKDNFVIYSPECFIKIQNDCISSFPMKGTFYGNLSQVKRDMKTDLKEINEHNTIVDLIRNDLSKYAKQIQLTRFRYLEKIKTSKKDIYQTSSTIQGKLYKDWKKQLPELLFSLLPAGSISGAPKEKTIQIIKEVEKEKRGYYTGVFGYFDGENLDSGINIRYLEKKDGVSRYRSGGGITSLSDLDTEYNELIEKIYVPVV